MNCHKCLQQFHDNGGGDDDLFVMGVEPHILIQCGHSVCKSCIIQISEEYKQDNENDIAKGMVCVPCPECQTISQAENLNSFPKNFALLNMVKSQLTSQTTDKALPSPTHLDDLKDLSSNENYLKARRSDLVSQSTQGVPDRQHHQEYLKDLDLSEQVSLQQSQGGQGDQNSTNKKKGGRNHNFKYDGEAPNTARMMRDFNEERDEMEGLSIGRLSGENLQLKSQNSVRTGIVFQQVEVDERFVCDNHGKNIEGYCLQDKQVLCIDCILSGDHKNHEITAVSNAAKQEKDQLTVKYQLSKSLQEQVKANHQKASKHQESLEILAQENVQKIQQIYSDLRVLLEEKEKAQIQEIQTKLAKEQKYLENKKKDSETHLLAIDQFQSSWNKLGEIDDIILLKEMEGKYYQEAAKALVEPKSVKINQVLGKVTKEAEFVGIAKYITNSLGGGSQGVPQPMESKVQMEKQDTLRSRYEQHSTTSNTINPSPLNSLKSNIPKSTNKRRESTQRSGLQSAAKLNNLQSIRSTSSRPSTLTNDLSTRNNSASYMQATKTWANRKNQITKQKEDLNQQKIEEKKNQIDKKGFTTLGHASQTSGGGAPVKEKDNNYQQEVGAGLKGISTKEGQGLGTAKQRLQSRDRRTGTQLQSYQHHTSTGSSTIFTSRNRPQGSSFAGQTDRGTTQKTDRSPVPQNSSQIGVSSKIGLAAKNELSRKNTGKQRIGSPLAAFNAALESKCEKNERLQKSITELKHSNEKVLQAKQSLEQLELKNKSHHKLSTSKISKPTTKDVKVSHLHIDEGSGSIEKVDKSKQNSFKNASLQTKETESLRQAGQGSKTSGLPKQTKSFVEIRNQYKNKKMEDEQQQENEKGEVYQGCLLEEKLGQIVRQLDEQKTQHQNYTMQGTSTRIASQTTRLNQARNQKHQLLKHSEDAPKRTGWKSNQNQKNSEDNKFSSSQQIISLQEYSNDENSGQIQQVKTLHWSGSTPKLFGPGEGQVIVASVPKGSQEAPVPSSSIPPRQRWQKQKTTKQTNMFGVAEARPSSKKFPTSTEKRQPKDVIENENDQKIEVQLGMPRRQDRFISLESDRKRSKKRENSRYDTKNDHDISDEVEKAYKDVDMQTKKQEQQQTIKRIRYADLVECDSPESPLKKMPIKTNEQINFYPQLKVVSTPASMISSPKKVESVDLKSHKEATNIAGFNTQAYYDQIQHRQQQFNHMKLQPKDLEESQIHKLQLPEPMDQTILSQSQLQSHQSIQISQRDKISNQQEYYDQLNKLNVQNQLLKQSQTDQSSLDLLQQSSIVAKNQLTLQSIQSSQGKGSKGGNDILTLYNQDRLDNRETTPYIYVISGYCDEPLSGVERLKLNLSSSTSPMKQEREPEIWEQMCSLNIPRTKFQAVVVDFDLLKQVENPDSYKNYGQKQQIVILGGKNADSIRIDSMEVYDPEVNKWITSNSIKMRKAKSGFSSIIFRNPQKGISQLFVIGGNDGQVQNRVEYMNLTDLRWYKCQSMINRRDELAGCLGPDNKIYAIGGYGGSTNASCLKSVERYNPLNDKWEEVRPMQEGRRALAAVAMPDGIYAVGGYNGKDYISSIERYDIIKDQWSLVCHLNTPKCTISALAAPNFQSFYVLGGFNGMQLDEIERFDVEKEQFTMFTPFMSQRRFMHSSVIMS